MPPTVDDYSDFSPAFIAGYKAYPQLEFTENPYEYPSDENADWQDGYFQAEADANPDSLPF